MPIRIRCPNGHALSVPEERKGKQVRCPRCKELFAAVPADAKATAEDTPAKTKAEPPRRPVKRPPVDEEDDAPVKSSPKKKPAPPRRPAKKVDDDEDDFETDSESPQTPEERRKERQRDKKARLRNVSLGLLIHTVKLWVLVVLVFFVFLTWIFGVTVATAQMPSTTRDLSREAVELFLTFTGIGAILVMVLVVVMPIIGVVGSGYCCTIPKKSDARTTIMAALVFDVIPLVASLLIPLTVFNVFGMAPVSQNRLQNLLLGGSVFFSVGALFVFGIFLRQLAFYVQKPHISAEALNMVSWLVILSLVAPLVLYLMGYLSPMLTGMLGSPSTIGVLFLLTLIWFALFYYIFFRGMLRVIAGIRAEIGDVT